MMTQIIDTDQAAKVSRFAKIWPIFLSGLVLIIPFIFCLANFSMLFNARRLDFAVLAIHNNLMNSLSAAIRPPNAVPTGIIIWILVSLCFAATAQTNLGKIAVLFSFASAILIMLCGYMFGVMVGFNRVDSLVVETRSFNLIYFYGGSDGREFYLHECDLEGRRCKAVWKSYLSPHESESGNGLQLDKINRQVEIFINGEVVYRHPVE